MPSARKQHASTLRGQQLDGLIQRLAEAEARVVQFVGPRTDAVMNPRTGTAILLREAQDALIESEGRYRRLLARVSAMVFELAPDGQILFINDATREIAGYDTQWLLGENWWTVFFPGERAAAADALRARLAQSDLINEHFVLTAQDGSHVTVEMSSANRYGSNGTLERIVGFGIDITTRIEAETALRYREQFLGMIGRLSTEFISAGIEDTDPLITESLRQVGEFTGVDRVYLLRVAEDGAAIECSHEWCADGMQLQPDAFQNISLADYPWASQHYQHGVPIVVSKVADMPTDAAAEKSRYLLEGVQSSLVMPVYCSNHLVALLGLRCQRHERGWSDDTVALIRLVGEMLANAIERRQTALILHRRRSFAEFVGTLSERLVRSQASQIEGAIRGALEMVGEFLEVDCASVASLGPDGTTWTMEYEWMGVAALVGKTKHLTAAGIPWAAARFGRLEPVIITDATEIPDARDREALEAVGLTSVVAIPLAEADAAFGLVAAGTCHRRKWRADEIALLRVVGEMIMKKVLRYQEAQVYAGLAHVGRELITLVDTPAVADRCCELVAEVLPCDATVVLLLRPDTQRYEPVARFGIAPEEWEELRLFGWSGPEPLPEFATLVPGRVMQVQTATADGAIGAVQKRFGFGSGLYVHLMAGETPIGFLGALLRDPDGVFARHTEGMAERIAQLASFALANAHLFDELGQANRVKADFMATMSHELRTPLHHILGFGDLLRDGSFGALTAEQEEAIDEINKSGRNLLSMIDATLNVAFVEAGRSVVKTSLVDPAILIEELRNETRDLVENTHQVALTWTVAPELPRVRTDAGKFKLVLRNLIQNATKFTPQGSVEIAVGTAGDEVGFTVSDTGIGIAPEILPVIFEPFRQGDSSTTRRYGGVGLGLYIVRRLLDLLGGRIEVDSTPGQGSTFAVWIPSEITPSVVSRRSDLPSAA